MIVIQSFLGCNSGDILMLHAYNQLFFELFQKWQETLIFECSFISTWHCHGKTSVKSVFKSSGPPTTQPELIPVSFA